ncbi:MAG: aminomethyl-transferring glycine dehydrogenase subunit GcvPB [Bacillota bacterium]
MSMQLIFERGANGRRAATLPASDVNEYDAPLARMLRREPPGLPEVSEIELVRHYTALSRRSHGVDDGFYPLGSCTMKYNPRCNERAAGMFQRLHPLQDERTVQGALEVLWRMERCLCALTGMDAVTLQPAAGAHGELCGLMVMRAYHHHNGQPQRNVIIVPDSAHGTNPASAAMAGYRVKEIPSNARGRVDLDALRQAVGEDTAGLMLTNPNTLGLFEEDILAIADIVHGAGGLLYYDGANMNAVMGIARPGDMAFDIVHVNVHKTLSTPHGGGGPGAGPVGVKTFLEPFLPVPAVREKDGVYSFDYSREHTIGRVKMFYGNFTVLVRGLAYILSLGAGGLREASENAVLNANYVLNGLKDVYQTAAEGHCMHECVLSAAGLNRYGVHALDVAKALIDEGIHPPTIYFPLIVKEALMIEPTETETRETLDAFIHAMKRIAKQAETEPEALKNAPRTTSVGRLDETGAARKPVLRV